MVAAFISSKRMVLAIFTLVFLGVSPLFMDRPAEAKSCRLNIPAAQVSVDLYKAQTKTNNRNSSGQLATKYGRHGNNLKKAGWVTRGLTKTDLESRIEVGIQYQKMGNNVYCVGLKSVEATIGYKLFRVYVARDLRPGSCEYRTTLDHEQAHVAIYMDQLLQFKPRFENRLQRVAANLKPVQSRSAESGHAYFLRKINSEFRQVFRQLNRETDRRQRRLDTPENYRREQALCPPRPDMLVR